MSASGRLRLARDQILAQRRRVASLDARLPMSVSALRTAGWAGLTDSMPRAALLSIHARVHGTQPNTWEDPALAQTWGPRFSTYVVPARDIAVFTLGRMPEHPKGPRNASDLAARLDTVLEGRKWLHDDAGRAMGMHPNGLRSAATTGRVLIRWGGARQATIWTIPPPTISQREAAMELARRYVHVFGPTNAESFNEWAGIGRGDGPRVFEWLADELLEVDTPIGTRVILGADEAALREGATSASPPAPARLLPSGDTFFLCWGADRELLVADPARRAQLWTSRVWPGALLVGGEIAGTWRRANEKLTIEPWRRLERSEQEAVEAEATSLPLPGLSKPIRVTWAS